MSEPGALILIIDDDAFSRAFASVVLVGEGYRVIEASTALDGLALAAQSRPRLVLLDYAMPQMTGTHVLRALRSDATNPEIAVIVLSAWVSEDVRKEVEDLRAIWLTKPLAAATLADAVNGAMT